VKRRTVIGLSAAGVVVCGLLWMALRPRPVSVEVEVVKPGPLRVTVDEDGRVRVRERYVLSSPLSGTLLRPSVRAGDPCARGVTLARIVPVAPPLLDARARSEVLARARAADDAAKRAEAALALARNELEQAERTLARAQKLGTAGSISQEAMERAQTDRAARARDVEVAERGRDVAWHERDATRAALVRTQERRTQPEDAWEITCPVQGVVLRVLQESEAVVQPGTPLFELGDLGAMEAVADVLTTEAVAIRPGARSPKCRRSGSRSSGSTWWPTWWTRRSGGAASETASAWSCTWSRPSCPEHCSCRSGRFSGKGTAGASSVSTAAGPC